MVTCHSVFEQDTEPHPKEVPEQDQESFNHHYYYYKFAFRAEQPVRFVTKQACKMGHMQTKKTQITHHV